MLTAKEAYLKALRRDIELCEFYIIQAAEQGELSCSYVVGKAVAKAEAIRGILADLGYDVEVSGEGGARAINISWKNAFVRPSFNYGGTVLFSAPTYTAEAVPAGLEVTND